MKKLTIVVFATKAGFERKFLYDQIARSENINYVLVENIHQIRGMEMQGWLIHFSAPEQLRRFVSANMDIINSRIR